VAGGRWFKIGGMLNDYQKLTIKSSAGFVFVMLSPPDSIRKGSNLCAYIVVEKIYY